jgi:non-heme chloroperoxidase
MFKLSDANFYRTDDNEQIFYNKNFKDYDPSKPVLIFNYGLVCSNHHWKYQLGYFDDLGYQILTHDYRGHFQSTTSHLEDITFTQMSKDIHGLAKFLGIEKAFLLGHSMGVNVCLQMAKEYPEFVSGMVLISGTFMPVKDVMFDSNVMEFIMPLVLAGKSKFPEAFEKIWASGGVNPLIKTIVHVTGFNKEKVPMEFIEIYLNRVALLGLDVFLQLFDQMTKQNITSSLDRMQIPTLIMGGMNDSVIPNHLQRTLASLMPQSQMYFLKEGSHVPQADYPELVNERIETFLQQSRS